MVDLRIELPKDFLEEEVRCDYVVSKKMKEVWAVELDLLSEFQRVCNKYNLKYYADAGTLLGAVRHKGFIPWDDDVDIIMPRDEYNKFCKIAIKEFDYPYFLQTNKTDPGSSRGHAQLRNSMTTAILGGKEFVTKHHQGIFIDVFPVDVVPDNKLLRNVHIVLLNSFFKLYFFASNCSVNYNPKDKRGKWKIRAVLNRFFNRTNTIIMNMSYHLYEMICSLFNSCKSQDWTILCSGPNKIFLKRSKYERSVELDFEFIKVPSPYLYEDVLCSCFGNWKEFVKGTSMHGHVFFDTDKSYKEYL